MKKVFLMMALLAAGMTAFAADEEDNDSKLDATWSKGKHGNWSAHFRVGVNVPTGAPDGFKFAPFRSWDLDVTLLQYDWKPGKGRQTYSIGLGYAWHNYTLKDNGTMFLKAPTGGVTGLGHFDESMSDTYSRVHTETLSMPVLFTQKVGKKQSFSIGAEVNLKTRAHITNGYEIDDTETRTKTTSIGVRPITVDIMGIYDFGDIGIYAKYSPMSVFKKDRGPEFQSLSFGFYF